MPFHFLQRHSFMFPILRLGFIFFLPQGEKMRGKKVVIATFSQGNAFMANTGGEKMKCFEGFQFNTDHSLTPNLFKIRL